MPQYRVLSARRPAPLLEETVKRYSLIAVVAAAVDLLTKHGAERLLLEKDAYALTERLSFMLVYNTGGRDGLEAGPLTWALHVLVTIAAIALIASVVRAMAAVDARAIPALGLVTGGAAGNLASMLVGPPGVADFLAVRISEHTTVIANIADLCLWTGAIMLVPVGLTLSRMIRLERAQKVAV